jgi:hypothetical protein
LACSMCERSARLISAVRLRSATLAMRSCLWSVVVICAHDHPLHICCLHSQSL